MLIALIFLRVCRKKKKQQKNQVGPNGFILYMCKSWLCVFSYMQLKDVQPCRKYSLSNDKRSLTTNLDFIILNTSIHILLYQK